MLLCFSFVAAACQDRAGGAPADSQYADQRYQLIWIDGDRPSTRYHALAKAPTTPNPVYIVYKTAWVHDGGVRFLKDLYAYDADQAARLFPASVAGEVTRGLETRR